MFGIPKLLFLLTLAATQEAPGLNGSGRQELDRSGLKQELEIMRRVLARELKNQLAATGGAFGSATGGPFGSAPTLSVNPSFTPGPTGSNSSAAYFAGCGAVFFFDVDYPVAPPEGQIAENEVSLWQEIKAEVEGRPVARADAPKYDKKHLENIRQSALSAIATHGANLTHIGHDEFVVVVFRGTGFGTRHDNPFLRANPVRSGLDQTLWSVSVPFKSITDYDSSRITLEQLQQVARITQY